MAYRLPPLPAVRVFEAAARHLSFTRAAEELGMTQAAVSYQIKLLEERVGTPLFLRKTRAVVLTEAGARLAPAASHAMATLETAFGAVRDEAEGGLVVATFSTFATQWLVPRLGQFQTAHPAVSVRLKAAQNMEDLGWDDTFDVAIRIGHGHWPGFVSHRLFDVAFTPLMSPALAEKCAPLREPADLLQLPLIDPTDIWWPDWFKAVGVDFAQPDSSALTLGAQYLQARAALAGQGVAILSPHLYEEELSKGMLCAPFPQAVVGDGWAYCLIYPEERRARPKIRAFRDWLLDAVSRSPVTGPVLIVPR